MQIMIEVSFHLINVVNSVHLQCLLCIYGYSEFDVISFHPQASQIPLPRLLWMVQDNATQQTP